MWWVALVSGYHRGSLVLIWNRNRGPPRIWLRRTREVLTFGIVRQSEWETFAARRMLRSWRRNPICIGNVGLCRRWIKKLMFIKTIFLSQKKRFNIHVPYMDRAARWWNCHIPQADCQEWHRYGPPIRWENQWQRESSGLVW